MFFAGVTLLSMSGFLEMVSTTLFPQGMSLDPIKTISEYASVAKKAEDVDIAQKYLIFSLFKYLNLFNSLKSLSPNIVRAVFLHLLPSGPCF